MMKLSIIILTCNSKKWIGACIKSIFSTAGTFPKEWIIVDNGSIDGSQEIVKNLLSQVILIQNQTNVGIARARNQGIKVSTGDYLMFLDHDASVLENTINELCNYLDQHLQCGLVGPQLVNPDGTLQANSLPLPSIRIKVNRIFKKITGQASQNIYKEFIDSGSPFHPGYLIGACLLIRSEAISSVGLFDEYFFYGPDDADYCIRIKEQGYEVVCLPTVKVIHVYQQKSYQLKKIGLLWSHFKGLCYFWRKHRTIKFI